MSLTTRSLRLHLLSVLGTPLAGAKVTLQLSAYQADETDIVPLVWALPEDPAVPGDYVGPIWPNTRGDGGTHYDLLVQANGQVLLTQVVTVVAGTAQAVLKAKINAAPYPAVYAAEAVVGVANVFADAAGESASRAQAAVGSVNQVVEDYGTVGAAASLATQKAVVATDRAAFADARASASEVSRQGAAAALSGAVAAGENVGSFKTKLIADAKLAAGGIPLDKSVTITADGLNNGMWVNRAGVLEHESADTLPAVASRNFQLEADSEWLLKYQHKLSETIAQLGFGLDRSGKFYSRIHPETEFDESGLLSNRLVASGVGALMEIVAGILSVPKGLQFGDASKIGFIRNEDYWLAGVDANGNVGDLAYGRDGLIHPDALKRITGRLNPDDLSSAFLARLQSQSSYVASITGATPNRRLYVDDANGTRRLITSTGDPHDAYIVASGHVFWTDSAGVQMYAPCSGGAPYRVLPEAAGASYGDSLTVSLGTNWPGLIGATLGIPWAVEATGGMASSDVTLRQHGLVPTVVIAGGSIPASGPVTLTISPADAWGTGIPGGSFTFPGSIAGIAGSLVHTHNTDVWTFTRTASGSVTAVPDGTKFQSSAPDYSSRVCTFFFGYNNQYSTGTRYTAIRDYALAAANVKTYVKRYLVFGLVNSAIEPTGSDGLKDVLSINATLAATYGVRYFDYRSWLLNEAMDAAGIAWTANDIADKASGIVPRSLRIAGPPLDPVHLVPAAYAAIAPKVVSIMSNLGWF